MILFNWFKRTFKKRKTDLTVGTLFVKRNEVFKVEKALKISGFVLPCRGCDFLEFECCEFACKKEEREDGQDVIFKDITGKLIQTNVLRIKAQQ